VLRKGFVQQQVERLGSVLTHILGLKQSGSTEAALEAVRQAGKDLTSMDLEVLSALPDQTMLSLFGLGGAVDPARAYAAGILLMEQAEMMESSSAGTADTAAATAPDAATRRRKALLLLSEALLHEAVLRTDDARARLAALIAAADADGQLGVPVRYHLLRYFEGTGDYAKAEDQVYALEDLGDPKALATARWLYNRLSHLPDPFLTSGGLSREEVEEGLQRVTDADRT
jgi:hypothetical protein